MGKTIIFFLLSSAMTLVAGSLAAQRNTGKPDSQYVFQLLQKADDLFDLTKYDSALSTARTALLYSRQNQYLAGETWSLIKMNDALLEKDELTEADNNASVIYRNGVKLKDSAIIGISWLHKGQARLYRSETDSAIYYFEKSLYRKLELAHISYSGLCYNELGYAWGRKDNEDKMMEYCLKGFTIYESLNDAVGCAMTLGNIATIYSNLGQKQKAIEYSKRSLVYRQKVGDFNKLSLVCSKLSRQYLYINIDSAVKYQRLCEVYAIQSGIQHRMAESYITAAVVANVQGKKEQAFESELKAVQILETSQADLWLLANQYLAIAYYAEVLKMDSSTILSYYDKGIQLAERIKSKSHLYQLYRYKSDYYWSQKNYEPAYWHFKKYILYKDSLALADQQRNVEELEAKYQTAKKDIEIQKLNADQRIKLLEIEKQKAIIGGNLLEAKQKEIAINLLQQQQQLQDIRLAQQKETLDKQQLLTKNREQQIQIVQKEKQLNEKRLNSQKQMRNGMLAGTGLLLLLGGIGFSRYQLKKKLEQQKSLEEMRNHIASDLHDDVGASLSNINILNELTRRNADNPAKVNEYLSKASDDIRQVSEGISDIVWNINPRYDNLEHLFVRMKRYAADIMDAKNINYQIEFPDQASDIKLDMDKRRDLYLLFKEAINNLAKYSKARMARIQLSRENNKLQLLVQDDGVGFNAEQVISGNGLQNMRQRAVLLNGKLDISSNINQGTRLKLEMQL